MKPINASPARSSGRGRTRHAPRVNEIATSKTATSKPGAANCSTRLVGSIASLDACVTTRFHDAAMRDGDAFWFACGSGSVDDIGEILGAGAGWETSVVLASDRRELHVETHCLDRVRQTRKQRLGGEHQDRRGVLDHIGEALVGIIGVERQIGSARLENREQADHHLQRALDANPHCPFRPDPASTRRRASRFASASSS